MSNKKIVGIFVSQEATVVVIKRLKQDGYRDHEISVLAKNMEDSTENSLSQLGLRTFPGAESYLARGPIAVTLAGLAVGRAKGGIIESLIDMGVSEDDAKEYKDYLEKGKALVMVDGDEERSERTSRTFTEHDSIKIGKYDNIEKRIEKIRAENEKYMPPPPFIG